MQGLFTCCHLQQDFYHQPALPCAWQISRSYSFLSLVFGSGRRTFLCTPGTCQQVGLVRTRISSAENIVLEPSVLASVADERLHPQ